MLSFMRKLISLLLSLYLGLFLVAGVVSLADDSLVLLFSLHLLTAMSAILSCLALLMTLLVYGLMGLTPVVPRRLVLPVAFFYVANFLVVLPAMIYFPYRVLQLDWVMSFGQVIFGLGVVYWLQKGLKFRWQIVEEHHLGNRRFSWLNLSLFVLANVFILVPVVVAYAIFCVTLAVNHFGEGFLALHRDGMTVQVRKYIRDDGKTIELIPMAHIADANFYRKMSQLSPTNSIILMEGVTDEKHRLTNEISYKRMATSLGLAEQEKEFEPTRGQLVMADVDAELFSTDTVDFLNLVMLFHSKGVNSVTLQQALRYSPPPDLLEQIAGDLLEKRNQHLWGEIQARLPQSDDLIVPWGVAHMPEIARDLQKSGFHLDKTRDYTVIRFHFFRNQK